MYASRDVEEEDTSDRKVCRLVAHSVTYSYVFYYYQETVPTSNNTFDHLPALSAPCQSDLRDELERYLAIDPEEVADALLWWFERKHLYPRLYRMALDYLSIPRKSLCILLLFDD